MANKIFICMIKWTFECAMQRMKNNNGIEHITEKKKTLVDY